MSPRKKTEQNAGRGTVEEVWITDLRNRMNRNYEAGFKDGQAAEQEKIRRQLGLGSTAPTAAKKPVAKAAAKPPKKKRKNPWAGLSAEERAARIAKRWPAKGVQNPGYRAPPPPRMAPAGQPLDSHYPAQAHHAKPVDNEPDASEGV